MKKITLFSVLFMFFVLAFVFPRSTQAAAPDGAGPWADSVVTSSQGNTKGGTPVSTVNPARSNPTSTVGVAEGDTVDSHFFSLGFGGSITLGFDNGISSGTFVVEATNMPYPTEQARVELSADGSTWYTAGVVSQSGSVSMPTALSCAKYARITDVSNPNDFSDNNADGYDVDGVRAEGESCVVVTPTPTPTPTPGGGSGCTVVQSNTLGVLTVVGTNLNTGNNVVKKTTGGNVKVKTGSATATITTSVTGGINTASGCCCCSTPSAVSALITGNGAGSRSRILIKK